MAQKEPEILTVWLDHNRVALDAQQGDVIDFLLHVRELKESGLLEMLDPMEPDISREARFILSVPLGCVKAWIEQHPTLATRLWRTRVGKTRWEKL